MCDYSLEMYASRPARTSELYVTTRFPSGTIGWRCPAIARPQSVSNMIRLSRSKAYRAICKCASVLVVVFERLQHG